MINTSTRDGNTPMQLNHFKRRNTAIRALREHFDYNLDLTNVDRRQAKNMLTKVMRLINEAKANPGFHRSENNPTYLKLLFMAEALSNHYGQFSPGRIISENVEVDKSQVILAAQDVIDSVQKMVEEVNDILVKELPALVDRIQSEIGVNEANTFGQSANETLSTLNQTLMQSRQSLQDAMNQMTGQGGTGGDMMGLPPEGGEDMEEPDMGDMDDMDDEGEEVDVDVDVDAEMPDEMPPARPTGGVGRERR
jgi:hypothetical protein